MSPTVIRAHFGAVEVIRSPQFLNCDSPSPVFIRLPLTLTLSPHAGRGEKTGKSPLPVARFRANGERVRVRGESWVRIRPAYSFTMMWRGTV